MMQYSIYMDDVLVYATGIENYHPDYCCYNATLQHELNAAGSLEFTMPYNHPMYDNYVKLATTVTLKLNGELIWKGRVLNDEKDIYLNKTVFCEGELAFLNDIVARPYDRSYGVSVEDYFHWMIDIHNAPLPAGHPRRIEYGYSEVEIPYGYILAPVSEQGDNVLNELTSNLLNEFGGYLRIRHEKNLSYIDYIQDFEAASYSDQVIQFGVNLVDIQEASTAESVYTVLIPYGKKDSETGERVTIKSVNNNRDWIANEDAVAVYGNIEKIVFFDDAETPEDLLEAAREELDSEDNLLSHTITINAVDMHMLDDSVESINVGDYVGIVSLPNEISAYFLCDAVSLNLNDPSQNQYTFGSGLRYLTDSQAREAKISGAALIAATEYDRRPMTAMEALSLW